MADTLPKLPKDDPTTLLTFANLVALKAASPLYAAEARSLKRELVRREEAGLDVDAQQNRLAASERRLALYNNEVALANRAGDVPSGAMIIQGVVTSNGRPAPDLAIAAYDLDGKAVKPAVTTDASGSFLLTVRVKRDVRIVVSTSKLEVLLCHDVTFQFVEGKRYAVRIDLRTTEPVPIDPKYPCGEPGSEPLGQTVPRLLGFPRDLAAQKLEAAQLEGVFHSAPSSETEGTVVLTEPVAGTSVAVGSTVNVVLAVRRMAVVPGVVNKTEAVARKELEPEFALEVVPTRDGETAGLIVRQFPAAGVSVELPATVTVLIREPDPSPPAGAVPELIGRELDAARKLLEQSGFRLGQVTFAEVTTVAGRVLEQVPKAGVAQPLGTAVAVNVSMPAKPTPNEEIKLPSVVGKAEKDALARLHEAGFVRVRVSYRSSDRLSGTILQQTPPGGSNQTKSVAVALVAAKRQAELPPTLVGLGLRELAASLEAADLVGPRLIIAGESSSFEVKEQKAEAGASPSGKPALTLTVRVPAAWQRNPAMAVANLASLHAGWSQSGATAEQQAAIVSKLSSMSLADIDALLKKGENGISSGLTRAKRINKAALHASIAYGRDAVGGGSKE